jgi:hypothetical protein
MESVDPSSLLSKRVVYVAGLPDQATAFVIRATFIPFGDIRGVDMVNMKTNEVVL